MKPQVCFLRRFTPLPCDGRLVKAHLIPRQLLLREIAVERSAGAVWDDRVWVWACGGITGVSGHHGMLDASRTLRIPRAALPPDLEEFADEHGLGWWLDREYGGTT